MGGVFVNCRRSRIAGCNACVSDFRWNKTWRYFPRISGRAQMEGVFVKCKRHRIARCNPWVSVSPRLLYSYFK